MAGPYYYDRVKDTTTTTGTGTFTLANSAPTGFRTFGSVLSDGDTCYYTIVGGAEWEVGIGTYATSGTTLARTRVISSSNSNAAVNFSAGTKDVFISVPSEQIQWLPRITPPVDADFAWINQGSASVSAGSGGIFLTAPSNGGSHNFRIRKKSAPTAPYTVTMLLGLPPTSAVSSAYGVLWRNSSSGNLVPFYLIPVSNIGTQLQVSKWDSPSAFNAAYLSLTGAMIGLSGLYVWVRLADDNTNRIISGSADGQNWVVLHSVGRTDYITADEIGFFVNPFSSITGINLLSYKEE